MTFTDKIIKSSTTPIHYLWGKNAQGNKYHWLIMCPSEKYQSLKQNFGKPNINPEDYGTLIASGNGHEVPETTKIILKEKYNLDFDEYFS